MDLAMARMLDDDELGAYIALVAAGDLMKRSVAAQLAEHDLTSLQFSILAELLAHPEGLRMHDLAERMVISRSGLTYQITQLESQGLVARTASSGDDRGVEVQLAEAGRERVLAAFPTHVELVRGVFLDVVEPEQLAPLRATLEQVVEKLRARPRVKRSVRSA
jgi:DNA-binding MarR family transcriptional regulator